MGYLFLFVALFAGATKGFCGKKTSGFVTAYKDAAFTNFIRMMFCIIIGFILLVAEGNVRLIAIDTKTLFITALSGITTSVFVVTWLLSVRKGAYMMLDVFIMLGIIVPIALSFMLFNEAITLKQIIGIAVLFVAVIIMCSYNNQVKEKMSISSLILLIICGVSNGLTDFSQKLFIKSNPDGSIAVFSFYTYIFSAAVLLLVYLFAKSNHEGNQSANSALKSILIYVVIMSVCLFANSYFMTKAAIYLPSAQLYPLSRGASLILSSVMSALFFKEKLTSRCITGIVISFIGLIIINVL